MQEDARNAYRIFRTDPRHRSLQFKKLEGTDEIYSARIGLGYRALATLTKDGALWYWIGTHADYDQLT